MKKTYRSKNNCIRFIHPASYCSDLWPEQGQARSVYAEISTLRVVFLHKTLPLPTAASFQPMNKRTPVKESKVY